MKEHLSLQQIEDYCQQRLSPAALLGVDDHLTACATCRQRVETALPATALSFYAGWEAAEALHLPFEQLAGYVDETLNLAAQQMAADHLAACAECAHAAADLRAFTAESATQPSRAAVAQVAEAGWWNKLRALLSAPAPAFGLALAALILVVLAGWLLRLVRQDRSAPPQFAGGTTSPTISPPPSPAPSLSVMPESAPVLARLNDGGGQITLDQQGKLTGLEHLPPAYQQMVKAALTSERLAQPVTLAGLNRRASALMGSDEQGNQFSLRAPVGKVVLSDRPTFRWTPLEGAASYVVEVYDEQFNLARKSPELPGTEWTPPQPLTRDRLYAWQVKANKDGQELQAPKPPAQQARFRVLAQTQADEIARARRDYANSHLTLGLLYAQAGLLDEAERELRALRSANPDAAQVRRLQAQVQALRR